MRNQRTLALGALILAGLLVAAILSLSAPAAGQDGTRFFPQTGHTVGGRFLVYWDQHGGLAQQGYPLTEPIPEVSDVNGQTYTVQYFERAVFEDHPEYGPPYDVLLSLLGVFEYQKRYGTAGGPGQHANTENPRFFAETGHTVGGAFRAYWESHGGLAQQGYPISDEFTEISALDGRPYTVQYFQRAVFEFHPENAGTPYLVLLSQLGTFRHRARFGTLSIPPPAPDHIQFGVQGSDAFLVWNEAARPGLGAGTSDIRGLDLSTERPITVTAAPGDQLHPAIAGSLVVWEDQGHSCAGCEADILGKDLATGRLFAVATGPADQTQPAIAGRKVAWIESMSNTRQLLLKDLDAAGPDRVATLAPFRTFGPPALSEEYLVWSEVDPNAPPAASAGTLQAYNLKTHTIQALADLHNWSATYAIADHRVVWADNGVHFRDLNTGETALLAPAGRTPAIRAGTVVWAQPGTGGDELWGLRLADRRALALVAGPGGRANPVLAGDWLAWENVGGAGDGRLGVAGLAGLFATASATTPTPSPPPSPTVSIYPTPLPTVPTSPTAGPGIRLYAANVIGTPIAGGNYVFYLTEIQGPPETPTPAPGRDQSLFAANLDRQETFLVKSSPALKEHLASDGRTLAWIERPVGGRAAIRGYDLTTRQESAIGVAGAAESIGGLALDGGVLYYADATPGHSGLYAHPLAGGAETLISPAGANPVAADGALLWSEEAVVGPGNGRQVTLHLRRPATGSGDAILATSSAGFGSYSLAGTNVVWTALGPDPADARAHLYDIRTGATRVISDGPVEHVAVGGHYAVWDELTIPTPGLGALVSIRAYNLATGTLATPVDHVPGGVQPWAVVANAVLLTVETLPPRGTKELYLQNLEP